MICLDNLYYAFINTYLIKINFVLLFFLSKVTCTKPRMSTSTGENEQTCKSSVYHISTLKYCVTSAMFWWDFV